MFDSSVKVTMTVRVGHPVSGQQIFDAVERLMGPNFYVGWGEVLDGTVWERVGAQSVPDSSTIPWRVAVDKGEGLVLLINRKDRYGRIFVVGSSDSLYDVETVSAFLARIRDHLQMALA